MADSSTIDETKAFEHFAKHKAKHCRSSVQKSLEDKKKARDVQSVAFFKNREAGKIYAAPKDGPIQMTAVPCSRKIPHEGYRLRRENNSFIVDVQPETRDKKFLSELEFDYTDPVQRWLLNCYGKEITEKSSGNPTANCDPRAKVGSEMPIKGHRRNRQNLFLEEHRNIENGWNTNDGSEIIKAPGVPVQNSHESKNPTVLSRAKAAGRNQCSSQGNTFGVFPSNGSNAFSTSQHSASGNNNFPSDDTSKMTHCDMSSINDVHLKGETEQLQFRNDFVPKASLKEDYAASVKMPPRPAPTLVRNSSSPQICKNDATDITFSGKDFQRRFSCFEASRMPNCDKEQNLNHRKDTRSKVSASAKSSPMIYRSVSLPSPSLSTQSDYDPYRWYSSSVKERVQCLERDLAGNIKTDWMSSQSDIHSMVSLDSDRIAPDGENYKLVFISSAASLDSDVDNNWQNNSGNHEDSFSKLREKAYRLARSVSDSIDWDLSFDSSVDDLSSLTEDNCSRFKIEEMKSVPGPSSGIYDNCPTYNKESSFTENRLQRNNLSEISESDRGCEKKMKTQLFTSNTLCNSDTKSNPNVLYSDASVTNSHPTCYKESTTDKKHEGSKSSEGNKVAEGKYLQQENAGTDVLQPKSITQAKNVAPYNLLSANISSHDMTCNKEHASVAERHEISDFSKISDCEIAKNLVGKTMDTHESKINSNLQDTEVGGNHSKQTKVSIPKCVSPHSKFATQEQIQDSEPTNAAQDINIVTNYLEKQESKPETAIQGPNIVTNYSVELQMPNSTNSIRYISNNAVELQVPNSESSIRDINVSNHAVELQVPEFASTVPDVNVSNNAVEPQVPESATSIRDINVSNHELELQASQCSGGTLGTNFVTSCFLTIEAPEPEGVEQEPNIASCHPCTDNSDMFHLQPCDKDNNVAKRKHVSDYCSANSDSNKSGVAKRLAQTKGAIRVLKRESAVEEDLEVTNDLCSWDNITDKDDSKFSKENITQNKILQTNDSSTASYADKVVVQRSLESEIQVHTITPGGVNEDGILKNLTYSDNNITENLDGFLLVHTEAMKCSYSKFNEDFLLQKAAPSFEDPGKPLNQHATPVEKDIFENQSGTENFQEKRVMSESKSKLEGRISNENNVMKEIRLSQEKCSDAQTEFKCNSEIGWERKLQNFLKKPSACFLDAWITTGNDISNELNHTQKERFIHNGRFSPKLQTNRFSSTNEYVPFSHNGLFSAHDVARLSSYDETDVSAECSAFLQTSWDHVRSKFSSVLFDQIWGLMTGISFMNPFQMRFDTVNHSGLATSHDAGNNSGRAVYLVHCHGPRLSVTETLDINNIRLRCGFPVDRWNDCCTKANISRLNVGSMVKGSKKPTARATKELLQEICEFLSRNVSMKLKNNVLVIIHSDFDLIGALHGVVSQRQKGISHRHDKKQQTQSQTFTLKKSNHSRNCLDCKSYAVASSSENTLLKTEKPSTEKHISKNRRHDDPVFTAAKRLCSVSNKRNPPASLKEGSKNNDEASNAYKSNLAGIGCEKGFFPQAVPYDLNEMQPLKIETQNNFSSHILKPQTRYFCIKRRKCKIYSTCTSNHRPSEAELPLFHKSDGTEERLAKFENKERQHIAKKTVGLTSNEKEEYPFDGKRNVNKFHCYYSVSSETNSGRSFSSSDFSEANPDEGVNNGSPNSIQDRLKKNSHGFLLDPNQHELENKRVIFTLKNSLEKNESLILHKSNYILRKSKKFSSHVLEHRKRHLLTENTSDLCFLLFLKNKITKMESNVCVNFGTDNSAHYRLSCGSVKSEITDEKDKKQNQSKAGGKRGIIAKSRSRKCLACSFLRDNRPTMKPGLAEEKSVNARSATFSSNRKKTNPTWRLKKSHDPSIVEKPGGTSNAGKRRADVPRGFTRSENPASPETGVIDTRCTSETGSTAFVELRPSQFPDAVAAPECERRPPTRLGLTVPADQVTAAERALHSPSTFGRKEAGASSAVVVPYSPVTKHSADGVDPDTHLPQQHGSELLNQGVLSVDYTLDYGNQDNVSLPPACVAGQAELTTTCSAPDCHATKPSDLPRIQLGTVMSTSETSREYDKHVRVYGSKVSQLKKFFDSCANSSCEASLEFDEQNYSSLGSTSNENYVEQRLSTVSSSMGDYQQQVGSIAVPTFGNESDSSSVVKRHAVKEEDKQNNVDIVHNSSELSMLSRSNICSVSVESNCPPSTNEKGKPLWENSVDGEHGVLWKGCNVNNTASMKTPDNDQSGVPNDPLALSTAELNSLIAASRAELSKIEQPLNATRSTLENYFTNAFDSDKLQQSDVTVNKLKVNDAVEKWERNVDSSNSNLPCLNNVQKKNAHCCEHYSKNCDLCYECDVEEIGFDDVDDAVLSDTSSEDETHYACLSSAAHYEQAAYALHTIIEESCEESERDSRSVTPTNMEPTSKLERYFSWDIINDTELKRMEVEDSSTIFSDSLSEDSDSINDINKEIEPHLVSSRLEKYFTSGLLGSENYLYPDDAEFLDDMPVSDFEEETGHKISRSALLNSLEVRNSFDFQNNLNDYDSNKTASVSSQGYSKECSIENAGSDAGMDCSGNLFNLSLCANENADSDGSHVDVELSDDRFNKVDDENEFCTENPVINLTDESICSSDNNLSGSELYSQAVFSDNQISNFEENITENIDDSTAPAKEINNDVSEVDINTKNKLKNISDKESYFDESAQAIMKKIIVHLSDNSCHLGKEETSYHSAWKILETEIERMMQTVSPQLDQSNYNGSGIDSNNSDYGSDTVESVECFTTDEDDNCVEGKFQSSNSLEAQDLTSDVNRTTNTFISEETLDIWRKLMVSLKKDTLSLSQQDNCDENTKARLYIRDQIIALMHTVTTSQTNSPTENRKSASPLPDVSIVNSIKLVDTFEENSGVITTAVDSSNVIMSENSKDSVGNGEVKSVDEGISIDSTENISRDVIEAVEDKENHETEVSSADDKSCNANTCSPPSDTESRHLAVPSEILVDLSEVLEQQTGCQTTLLPDQSAAVNDLEEEEYLLESETKSCISENCSGDNSSQFSVYVDIKLDEKKTTVTERRCLDSEPQTEEENEEKSTKRSSIHLWLKDEANQPVRSSTDHFPSPDVIADPNFFPSQNIPSSDTETSSTIKDILVHDQCLEKPLGESQICAATSRDTGYYSFKSSEDSILSISDCGNQEELKESVIQEPVGDTPESEHVEAVSSVSKQSVPQNLSLSTNNIPENITGVETKFCTLPPKTKTTASRVSMHPQPSASTASRFFSPSAAFKKLATTKSYGVPSEMSIPSKYLKKYARSSSVDDDSLFGAASMPHLSTPNLNESHHFTADSDRESSLTLDDEMDTRRKYSSSSHSVLSLGSHSASMTSVYSAAGGRHYGYVCVSGDVLFGLNYNQKSQMMEVFVKQCRNLAAVDPKRNKSDPYVKVYLLPDKTKGGKRKTKTKKNTLNPVFNELLRFPVLKHELESRTLWLSVWNSDLFGRNDFLGEVMLALGYRLLDSPTLRWYPLQERSESPTSPLNYKGELFLALKYVPRDLSLESRFRPAPVISLRGALHVLVKEARNIMAMRSNGTSDPFCKSYLLPDKSKNSKQKTPIVKKTRHPKWYYTVVYEDLSVEELKERSLELTLWDHDKLTSNEFMGGIRLNTGTGLYHGVPVEWMDARRDEAALWQAMLERPNMWVDGSLPLRPTMQFIRN